VTDLWPWVKGLWSGETRKCQSWQLSNGPSSYFFVVVVLKGGLAMQPRLGLNSLSSYLSLLGS
jgi:hypothetical protein